MKGSGSRRALTSGRLPVVDLPIIQIIPELLAALERGGAVLTAEPGAGKTTRVPLACLEAPWFREQRIIMLEPRRLAARSAVNFMANRLGERPGDRIGYRVRGEARVGPRTRIEVVTEGILTRMLQSDPALEGVGLVIFDEFHERNLHGDLGLALCLEAQRHLRPDLRILVMSATLDPGPIARLMGDAPVLACPGRTFPVEVRYLAERPQGYPDQWAADAVRRALREESGDLLVFLPGRAEIFRVAERLSEALPSGVEVLELYADVSPEAQERALRPAPPGVRKVILATSIAETSLTIDGVRVVIDTGLSRLPRYDPRRELSGLETVSVSRAAADQRAGRAGRLGPGVCYRLWTESRHHELQSFHEPEICHSDLVPLALELSGWGVPDPGKLAFLTAPPSAALHQAFETLRTIGAVDELRVITPHGRELLRLGVHPRLGHMLVRAREVGCVRLACDVAAILEERELVAGGERDLDLASRWHVLEEARAGRYGPGVKRHGVSRVIHQAERLARFMSAPPRRGDPELLGVVLGFAYPERIGRRREDGGRRYLLQSGIGAEVRPGSRLERAEYLAVAELDGSTGHARIMLGEPIAPADLRTWFGGAMQTTRETFWDEQAGAVRARERTMLGAILVSERPVPPDPEAATAAVLAAIRRAGLEALPWSEGTRGIQVRSEWLRGRGLVEPEWPDLSLPALTTSLEEWLAPFLPKVLSWSDLARVDFTAALLSRLSWAQQRRLDELAPPMLTVPTGTTVRLDYSRDPPLLSVRLQEMLGQSDTPRIGGGRVPVTVELLSPARRPLQVTSDLRSFWRNSYPEVRKEMAGRYPKHVWPLDPLSAQPTRRAKPRGT